MTAYLPVGFLLFGSVSIALFALIMNWSVEGYEDESGFHIGFETPMPALAPVIEVEATYWQRTFERGAGNRGLDGESNVVHYAFRS